MKHFDVYLRGVTFLIRTDHASLRYIQTVKQLPAQFFRWIMTLEEYSYKIEVRKGILHGNADGMSRGCHGKACICDQLQQWEKRYNITKGKVIEGDEIPVLSFYCNHYDNEDMGLTCRKGECFVNAFRLNPKYSTAELGEMQKNDPDIGPVFAKYMEDPTVKPTWNQMSSCSAATKAYLMEWHRLTMFGGALYRNWESANGLNTVKQLLVPRCLQLEFCHQIHDTNVTAHMGRRRTLHALLHFCFWYKMIYDVRFWIQCCDVCQRRKQMQPNPKAPLQIQVSGEPNERVAMDIVGPLLKSKHGNQYILAITDYFSKYTEAYAMQDQTAETVAKIFVDKWITYKGEPMEIHTDQGANFESKLLKQVCNLYSVNKTRTTAYHPQSDGQVERYNKTVMSLVRNLLEKTQEWDEVLPKAMCAYNSTIHESTGFTPNRLWYGRELRYTVGRIVPNPEDMQDMTYCEYVKKMQDQLQIAYDVARDTLKKNAMYMKKYYDRGQFTIKYKPGQRCLIKDHSKVDKGAKKTKPKYEGPYWILDPVGEVNYRIQKEEGGPARVIHHNRMRRYNVKEIIDVPDWVMKLSKSGVKDKKLEPILQENEEAYDNITNERVNAKDPKEKLPKRPTAVKLVTKRKKVNQDTEKVKKLRKKRKLQLQKKKNIDIEDQQADELKRTMEGQQKAEKTTRLGRRIRPPDRYV